MLACLAQKNYRGAVVRNSKKTWLLALIVTLLPSVVGAAGLGRMTVLSALGQPLVGEIELVSVTREELGSLNARLASQDAYQQANLQFNPALVGARVTVERRPNGQHFLKIVSSRPVNEPFIDVLVEVTWAAGRLSREYTALLDPPGAAPAPAPRIAAVPESRPAPAPREQAGATPAPSRPGAAPTAGAKEYGPVQRGETLGKIAKEVKPEGVTLEQTLVALYRNNPDAFISKNMNLVRTGKILRVPEKEEIASIASSDAATEYRTHVADWSGYRQKVADAAGTVPAEQRTAVSGKITTKAEDQGKGGGPKDVVRLSKSEPAAAPKSQPRNTAERIRSLEEEVVARDKALSEANERISQLEKTIKDMQKLVELKSPGMAAAQQQAQQQAAAPKPEAKAAAKPDQPKPEAAKPGAATPTAKPEPAKPAEGPKPEAAAVPAEKPAAAQPEPKKPAQPAPPAAKPAPKPAPKAREPELMDQVVDAVSDPLYLGVGGGALVLGGLAFWLARRRRRHDTDDDDTLIAPRLGKTGDAGARAAVAAAAGQEPAGVQAAASDDVDPLAEAEVYIAYGRDGQAEEILKEALAKNPTREDVQLKLAEVYSARKDKASFAKIAEGLHKQTGGVGDNWIRAAAMGYALDPSNKLYEAGKDAVASVGTTGAATDIDLDLGMGDAGTATDITLDAGAADTAAGADTGILDLGAPDAPASPPEAAPDFSLEVPAAGGAQSDVALETAPAPAQDESGALDFQIELPKVSEEPTQAVPPAVAPAASADAGLDFKLDDLNLNLDSEPKTGAPVAGEKDGHWYDVQTKFDLAKAYQEMGDKDGAKEILQEVMKEGDAEQKAQAKTLMDSLG